MGDYRYERKYVIEQTSYKDIIGAIKTHSALFKEVYSERTVNSLYFDTPDLHNYFNGVNGSQKKAKVRIRWYDDNHNKSNLEIKAKHGIVGNKYTFKINDFSLEGNLRKTYLKMVKPLDIPFNIRGELNNLIPTTTNNFKRRYFVSADKKFRITIDYDLKFRRLLSSRYKNKFKEIDTVILEIKYPKSEDTNLRRITKELPFRLGKFSKYNMGIQSV